ncbi:T9SS type A sorting domain-containing protein, partial [candidate division WOR-3 bacterium]|nr:T9SS type A sorting domain-containing protein [candidate division WOR-3 bacterium]MBD3364431.1 T9SS type A sorting domain-containing protein [candidate division WOR-3 bacterium]
MDLPRPAVRVKRFRQVGASRTIESRRDEMKKVVIVLTLVLIGTGFAQWEAFEERVGNQLETPDLYPQVEDSLNVRFVGNWPFGPCNAIAYDESRHLVFLASGGGVYIIDVITPANPIKISERIHTKGVVEDLFYDSSNQLLYIAANEAGLEIWDVSVPLFPERRSSFDIQGATRSVYVSGQNAFVYTYNGEIPENILYLIDVSSPSYPKEVSSVNTIYAYDLCVSNSYVYLAGSAYFQVFDVSKPTQPKELGECYLNIINELSISGSYAYGVSWTGLTIVDIADPNNPEVVLCTQKGGNDLYISDNYLYIVGDQSFRVYEISDPLNPELISKCNTSYNSSSVCISADYAFVSYTASGLDVIKLTDMSEPERVSHFDAPRGLINLDISGDYAYIVDFNKGLCIVDISNSKLPKTVSFWRDSTLYHNPLSVFVSGSYSYVANHGEPYYEYKSSLRIVNISDPYHPRTVACIEIELPNTVMSAYVMNNYLYIAADLLYIYDIVDPSHPKEVSSYETRKYAYEVQVVYPYAYIADDDGFLILDISNPYQPIEVGYYDAPHSVRDLSVEGSFAYLGLVNTYDAEFIVIDISEPTDPCEVACLDGTIRDLTVVNSYAYVAGYHLKVIDISDPWNPQQVGFYRTPGEISLGLSVSGDYIYVADDVAGLQIFDNYHVDIEETPLCNTTSSRLEGFLNTLSYDLPFESQLTIYSADGRKILKTTLEGKGAWEAPSNMSQGVYFASLTTPSEVLRTKLVVIR